MGVRKTEGPINFMQVNPQLCREAPEADNSGVKKESLPTVNRSKFYGKRLLVNDCESLSDTKWECKCPTLSSSRNIAGTRCMF